MSIVLEGKIKYRKGKKWKIRYCILLQGAENRGILELYIVKDPADFHLAHHLLPHSQDTATAGGGGVGSFIPRLEKKLSISSTFTNSSESAGSLIASLPSNGGSTFDPSGISWKPMTFMDPVMGAQGSPSRLYANTSHWSQTIRESPPGTEYIGGAGSAASVPPPSFDRGFTQQLFPSCRPCRPVDRIYGFESGKHVDNEGSVIVLIGVKSVHCMAMQKLEEMFLWADKLRSLLKDTDSYFHVKLVKTSDGSRLSRNTHGSLHVQPGRLCFIAEPAQGNKFICSWSLVDIHDYEFGENTFKIIANKASGKGRGTHNFQVDSTTFEQFYSAVSRMKLAFEQRQPSGSFISSSSAPASGPTIVSGSPSASLVPEMTRLRGISDGPSTLKQAENMRTLGREDPSRPPRPRYHSDVPQTLTRVVNGSKNINYMQTTSLRGGFDPCKNDKIAQPADCQDSVNASAVSPPLCSNSTTRFVGGVFPTDEDFEEQERIPEVAGTGCKNYAAIENQPMVRTANLQSCPSHQPFSIDTAASSGYSDNSRSLQDHTCNSCAMSCYSDQLGSLYATSLFTTDNHSMARHAASSRAPPDHGGHIYCPMNSWSNPGQVADHSSLIEAKQQSYRRSNSVSIRFQNSWTKENNLAQSSKYNAPLESGSTNKGAPFRVHSLDDMSKGGPSIDKSDLIIRSVSDGDLGERARQVHNMSQSSESYPVKESCCSWKSGSSLSQPAVRKGSINHAISQATAGSDSRPRKVSPPTMGPPLDDIREEAPTTPGSEPTSLNFDTEYQGSKKADVAHNYVNLQQHNQLNSQVPLSSSSSSSHNRAPHPPAHSYVNLPSAHGYPGPRFTSPIEETLPEEVRNPRRNYALLSIPRSQGGGGGARTSLPTHSLSQRNASIRATTDLGQHVNYADIMTTPSVENSHLTSPPVNTNYVTVVMNHDTPTGSATNVSIRSNPHSRASFSSRNTSSVSSGYGSICMAPAPTPHLNYACIDGSRTEILGVLLMEDTHPQPVPRIEEGSRTMLLSKFSIFSKSSKR